MINTVWVVLCLQTEGTKWFVGFVSLAYSVHEVRRIELQPGFGCTGVDVPT